MNNGKNHSLAALLVGALFLLALLLLWPRAAAQTISLRGATGNGIDLANTVTVTGVGEVKVKPDVGYVTLAVETQADTAQDAQRENDQKVERVTSRLAVLGVGRDRIETVSVTLTPIYDSPKEPGQPPRVVAYRASYTLRVTADPLAQLGRIIDAAVAAGATRVESVRFGVKNEDALRDQALADAVRDARHQADVIARAAGISVRAIRSIVGGGAEVPFGPVYTDLARFGEAAATPIFPGEMTIRASATVVFEVK